MTGPEPDNEQNATVAAMLIANIAEQLAGVIAYYASAKGIDPGFTAEYVRQMRPNLAQTVHGYVMHTTASMSIELREREKLTLVLPQN